MLAKNFPINFFSFIVILILRNILYDKGVFVFCVCLCVVVLILRIGCRLTKQSLCRNELLVKL